MEETDGITFTIPRKLAWSIAFTLLSIGGISGWGAFRGDERYTALVTDIKDIKTSIREIRHNDEQTEAAVKVLSERHDNQVGECVRRLDKVENRR